MNILRLIVGALLLMTATFITASPYPNANNPGNIRSTNLNWMGEVDCPSEFECFENMYYGIRAMIKNLEAYHTKHDLKTIREVITRWAPPIENDTDNYVNFVAIFGLGVDPDDEIDYLSPEILPVLLYSMIRIETPSDDVSLYFIAEVAYDTLRTRYPAWERSDWRSAQAVGDEERRREVEEPSLHSGPVTARSQLEGGSVRSQPAHAMDSSHTGDNDNIGSCGVAFVSPGDLAGDYGGSWLDRVQSWISIYGRKGSDGMERGEGPSPNPTPHTPHVVYRGAILWREPSWPQQVVDFSYT